jgi:hypothetical protein
MDLIKQKVRLELNKFYPLKDDYNNFCNAEDGITDLVINEIENYKKKSFAPELLEALRVCYASLCTYGSHPIIEKQVENILKKTES